MSSSFFLKKELKTNKNKRPQKPTKGKDRNKSKKSHPTGPPPRKRARDNNDDEEIPSDDEIVSDIEGEQGAAKLTFSSDDGEEETAQDKRLRLAKEYLKEIEKQEAERAEENEVQQHVGQRLQTDYLESVGRLRHSIAASVECYDAENIVKLKHNRHHLPLCTLVLTPDGKHLYAGGKSQYVLRWNLETHRVDGFFDVQPHREEPDNGKKRRSQVIALCLSSDMKFLAVADGGNNIQIWCPKELKHLKTFKGHRDRVTGIVFRRDTHELYSSAGAKDRSVKIWSLDEMAYVETLYGHQMGITGIDALSRERAITAGGNDCTLRIWKITEESQLIYNGHKGNTENVKFLNDENFISSSDDGSLCLWSALKKKPLCTETIVHGKQENEEANWISALTCIVNTDLIATGSCDGYIRLWQSLDNGRKLKNILKIPVTGFVNNLAFNSDGTKLYAAIGQEHRLGRWWRIKEAKNEILVIDLLRSKPNTDS